MLTNPALIFLKNVSFLVYFFCSLQINYLLLFIDTPLPQTFYEVLKVLAGAYTPFVPDWEQDLPANYSYSLFFFFPMQAPNEIPKDFRFRRIGLTTDFIINGEKVIV